MYLKKKYIINGYCSSLFLILYGFFRLLIEIFREPDAHIGYLYGNFMTMGILLSIPMIVLGFIIFIKVNAKFRNNIKTNH